MDPPHSLGSIHPQFIADQLMFISYTDDAVQLILQGGQTKNVPDLVRVKSKHQVA